MKNKRARERTTIDVRASMLGIEKQKSLDPMLLSVNKRLNLKDVCGVNDHRRLKHFISDSCELKKERTSWRKKKSSLNVNKAAGSRRDGEKRGIKCVFIMMLVLIVKHVNDMNKGHKMMQY